jgi:hypothetical protein
VPASFDPSICPLICDSVPLRRQEQKARGKPGLLGPAHLPTVHYLRGSLR